jgi:hypothetical protein
MVTEPKGVARYLRGLGDARRLSVEWRRPSGYFGSLIMAECCASWRPPPTALFQLFSQ